VQGHRLTTARSADLAAAHRRRGIARLIAQMVVVWALAGGACLLGIVAVNVAAAGLRLGGAGFAGDFELTELLAATAIFAFLPYAQLTGAHIAAEIFTRRAGPRVLALIAAVAAVLAVGLAGVLIWRMAAGLADQRAFGAQTAILQVPIWWAYVPALISLGLWAAAALLNAAEALRAARTGPAPTADGGAGADGAGGRGGSGERGGGDV
jgi:TRAP-type C4-dicarboxylate transport system permease small subunit